MEWSEWIENTGERPDYPWDTEICWSTRVGSGPDGNTIGALNWDFNIGKFTILKYKVPLHLLPTIKIPRSMYLRAKEIIGGEKDVSL